MYKIIWLHDFVDESQADPSDEDTIVGGVDKLIEQSSPPYPLLHTQTPNI